MHRDPTLRKRNALVIPGALLVLIALVGILYAQGVRSDDVECEDGSQIVFAGACRSAALVLAIPLVIGLGLIIGGAFQRSRETCRLGHGTLATTVLALLIAAVVLPAVAAVALYSMEDPDAPYTLTVGEVDYGLPRVLGLAAAAIGFLAFLPYLVLYLGTGRPPACCREKSCFDPCYCDEEQAVAVAPPIPSFPAPETRPDETAQVTTSPWPGPPKREAHPLVPISAPLVSEQQPQQLDAPMDDAPMQPDTWPAPPPEPVNDPWAAKLPKSTNDPFATPTTETGVWTPPPPEADEESDALRARAAAKGKAKPAATKAGAAAATREKAAAKAPAKTATKKGRKVSTKKKE